VLKKPKSPSLEIIEQTPQDDEKKENSNDVQYLARPHQFTVLTSKKPFVFMGGGVGCGKTDVGSFWVFNKVQETPKDSFGLICANSYTQLIDSTINNLYKNYKRYGITILPEEAPKTNKPFSIRIRNKIGNYWVEIKCRSLENYDILSGIEVPWWLY
jgi:hypothetical protein